MTQLIQTGWSWGCVSAIDFNGRTIWIADAHREDGKRFVVHADEKLTAFLELERIAIDCKSWASKKRGHKAHLTPVFRKKLVKRRCSPQPSLKLRVRR